MSVPYKTYDEAHDRMEHTVVWFDDQPVYVASLVPANGGASITYYPLPTATYDPATRAVKPLRKDVAPLSDRRWRVNELLLGYVNGVGKKDRPQIAGYLTRIPVRKWKQGLCHENLDIPGNCVHSFYELMALPAFKDTLIGKYPSIGTARKQVSKVDAYDEDRCRVAFSRQFALDYGADEIFWLIYRGSRVASSQDGEVFKLPKAKMYLKELIEQQGLRIIQ